MRLEELGFNSWFEEKIKYSKFSKENLARVIIVNKNKYTIRGQKSEVQAEVTGKIIYNAESKLALPTVGDWIFAEYFDKNTFAVIQEILPRKSTLKRKIAGKRIEFQLIASNIDIAFIMQSLDDDFNMRRLERFLVMTNESNIEPIVLLSKNDLISSEDLNNKIAEVRNINHDCRIAAFSNKDGNGLKQIENIIKPGMTYCLLGSSGVGKTTLINNLIGEDKYATGDVRKKGSKGRHITTRRQLIVLKEGGIIIDTPGMRELANIGARSGIDETFNDIYKLSGNCRYSDCTHTVEPGCSVTGALKNGEIDQKHYDNYLKLKKESEYNEMTYLEKRRKAKDFGKFIKEAKKNFRKR
jgi:ribosome biogenesis GTPase / thiamine phosphate phosphatase